MSITTIPPAHQSSQPTRKRKKDANPVIMKAIAKATESLDQVQKSMEQRGQTKQQDTYDLFGAAIAGMIRNLPNEKRTQAMANIMNIIHEQSTERPTTTTDYLSTYTYSNL